MPDVILHPGRDRSLRQRHPWLLSGAVARVEGDPEPGAWVRVVSAEGEPLGFGLYSPASQIRVRLLGFGKEPLDDSEIERRIATAVARREADPLLAGTDAVRLVNAEGDGLPGLVADRYGEIVVAKLSTVGMEVRRDRVSDALERATGVRHGFERADAPAARREGFAPRQGVWWGEEPSEPVPIVEGERRYFVDVVHGQKTGFYLDQRDARAWVARLAEGRRVLDLFSYTGGFAVAAAHGGASALTLVDSSAPALELALRNLEPYAVTIPIRTERGDAFRFVRRESGPYDLLIVDPPPLARHRAEQGRAVRAYREALGSVLRRAAPEALVLVFSCSYHVDGERLRRVAFQAALEAGRPLQVLGELGAPSDHPVSLDHPEGRYLHGLLLRA